MERYEKYKDSGVEWVGEIPNDWEVTKISSISACITGFAFKSEQFSFGEGVKLVRGDNVTEGNLRWGEKTRLWKKVTPDLEKFYLAENDIVVGMDGSKVGKNYALVQKKELPLLLVQRVARIRSKNASFAKWIEFAISSYDFKYYVNASKTDPAIPHITLKDIYDYKIFLPPADKIDSIVKILSKKLSELDTLITKKENLIALLKEERTAIINQAVTKGFDPDVEMKDSGVEWLGEIPASWEVKKLKYLLRNIRGGGTPSTDNPEYWEGSIPWVSPKDMKVAIIEATEDYVSEKAISESSTQLIEPNQLLIVVRSGILKHSLPLAINSVAVTLNQDMKALSTNELIDVNYMYWLFLGLAGLILNWCKKNGATVDSLDMEAFLNFNLAIPSLWEQDVLINYIVREKDRVDNLINKIEQEIVLLKEYRTALVSEVVSGKVKIV